MIPVRLKGSVSQPLKKGGGGGFLHLHCLIPPPTPLDGLRYPDLMPRTPHDAPVDLVIAAFAENLGDLVRQTKRGYPKTERVNNKRSKKTHVLFARGKNHPVLDVFLCGGLGQWRGSERCMVDLFK